MGGAGVGVPLLHGPAIGNSMLQVLAPQYCDTTGRPLKQKHEHPEQLYHAMQIGKLSRRAQLYGIEAFRCARELGRCYEKLHHAAKKIKGLIGGARCMLEKIFHLF